MLQESLSAADGDEIINALDGCHHAILIDHLQSGFGAIFDAPAGLENQLVIHVRSCLTQRAAVSVKTLLAPRRGHRAREERDPFVTQFEQMLRRRKAAEQIVSRDVGELRAKRGRVPEQHSRDIPRSQFLVNSRFSGHPVRGRNKHAIHPP